MVHIVVALNHSPCSESAVYGAALQMLSSEDDMKKDWLCWLATNRIGAKFTKEPKIPVRTDS